MRRILLSLGLLCFVMGSAQFNESAPWMKDIDSKETAKTGVTGHNLNDISKAFESYWKTRDNTIKGSGYKPFMRWEHHWRHYADPKGNLPTAKQLWSAWENKQNSSRTANPISNWQPIGPFEHLAENGRLPGQGRVNAIAIDPNNANTWYIGAPAGGLWKSTDAGNTWLTTTDELPQIGVSGIAIDPNNSNIIYIATGDDDAGDSFSVGVFKSTDGGTTWNQTGLNPSNSPTSMNDIYIDPTDSNVLWVATSLGVYKTINAGENWARKQTGNIKDIKLKPGDPNTIYAVTESRFFKSTNGGDSFDEVSTGLPTASGRLVLDVTPANPEYVYVLSAQTRTNDYAFQGIYRSTNSGETFSKRAETDNILESTQAWFDLALAVSPTNAEEIYVGCLNVWKSSNGGNNFTQLNSWFSNTPAYTHADIHMLRFFGATLFCASDGGIYSSTNNGATFTDHTAGAAISQFYRLSVSKSDASVIIGGLQDNGGFSLNNGQWRNYHGGDGMDNAIDPGNDDVLYGMTQNGGSLNISVNSGVNLSGQINPPTNDSGDEIEGNWVTPLEIANDGSLYAGFDALYKLDGNAWQKISSDFGSNIEEIIIDPNDPGVIYVINGRFLHKSSNSGIDFALIASFDTDISDMAINVSDSNTLYVTTSVLSTESTGVQVGKVFKSTNGGLLFEDITFDLPTDQPLFAIIHQGRNTDNPIYVGTSLGIYRLDDTLTSWEEYFTGLPNVAVTDMEINLDDEVLTVATYGRGIWQSPIPIQIPDNDVRLLSLNSPNNAQVICGNVIPEITIKNAGLNDITSVNISYTVNGTLNNTTYNQLVTPGNEAIIALPAFNLLTGQYELVVNTTITNDAYSSNNELQTSFFVNDFGAVDITNSFENIGDELLAYNEGDLENSEWKLGVPAGTLLNSAATGTQVYGTNLNGNHSNNTKSYIVTPCYDFSSLILPILSFDMAYQLEQDFDIVYVEYSIDQGNSWRVLGTIDSQPNWYNSNRTNISSGAADDCQNCPGAQWTGTDPANATMTNYSYDFTANKVAGETDLRGESNIVFRIVFHSDPSVEEEGAILDDLVILTQPDDNDDDNDGILDINDNCPLIPNADQLDTDGDGNGDICDDDDDNDGIPDLDDNCPLIVNVDQADFDSDGIGDLCDDDIDNDGVMNSIDQCPSTILGASVDVDGCEVFSLPANNFSVQTFSETCKASNNGKINVTATLPFTYTANINGSGGFNSVQAFTDTFELTGLTSGNYEICITLAEEAGYEQCFNATVSEPEDLSVTTKIESIANKVTMTLNGGERYFIQLNDELFTTQESEITLNLDLVQNVLIVKTDKDCQGVYKETIFLSDKVLIYPNPLTTGKLFVNLGDLNEDKVKISLSSISGQNIMTKDYPLQNGTLEISTSNLANGVYILNIRTTNSLMNFKLIKR